jgi:hypothetical protein
MVKSWIAARFTKRLSDIKKPGENLARFSQHTVVEGGPIRGFFRSNIDRPHRFTSGGVSLPSPVHETRSRMHHSRSSDHRQYRAPVEFGQDALHLEWDLAEPNDMRPYPTSALATWKFAFVSLAIFEWLAVAGVAARLEQFAMHVNQTLGASLLVEVVNILRAEEEAVA